VLAQQTSRLLAFRSELFACPAPGLNSAVRNPVDNRASRFEVHKVLALWRVVHIALNHEAHSVAILLELCLGADWLLSKVEVEEEYFENIFGFQDIRTGIF